MIDENLFTEMQPSKKDQPSAFLAIIDGVYPDGVTLRINGAVTQKHYLVNASAVFQPGDRVKVARISGTYLVEYKIGKPQQKGD